MVTFSDDEYEKLRSYLDTLPVGYPKTKTGVEISLLKRMFTPEEAYIARHTIMLGEPVRQIYRKLKKTMEITEEQLIEKLDMMAKKGAIFKIKKSSGEINYATAMLAIGMYEYQLDRLTKEYVVEFEEYIREGFINEFKNYPQLRVVPVEQSLEPENFIGTYDNIFRVINELDDRSSIALAECICRKGQRLLGHDCGHLQDSCLVIGTGADYYLDRGMARKISKAEAIEVMRKAQKEALVLESSNTQRPFAICACCGDCCEVLRNLKTLDKPASYIVSNYFCEVDHELCVGCGQCMDRCQMDALLMNDDGTKIQINLDRCIGCGNCVISCPNQALTLKQKAQPTIPPPHAGALYMEMAKKKNETVEKTN
jgi:ferredoxin